MKIEYKRLDDRDKELFLGHVVTWGAIIAGLVLAITLTHLSTPEPGENPPPAQAETAS